MATYFFETITDAQAATFVASIDNLVFGATGERVVTTTVTLGPGATAGTLVSGLTGKSVAFGDLVGAQIIFADGSLFLGSAAGDALSGTSGSDVMNGYGGGDTLSGSSGDDTLRGGAGTDELSGGSGADAFVFASGDSGVTAGAIDRITDWRELDGLVLGASSAGSDYLETSAASYAAALSLANTLIGNGSANFVAVEVGSDVVVFADTAANNGVAEDAVTLVGRTLADISSANIGPPPASPSVDPDRNLSGGNGPDTLTGGNGADTIDGGSGNDMLYGAGGDDRLASDYGNDLLDGGTGNDTYRAPGHAYVDLRISGPQEVNGFGQGDFVTLVSIENIESYAGDSTLVGDANDNRLSASLGENVLVGNDGADTLQGSQTSTPHSDTLSGGAGADSLNAAKGDDLLTGGTGVDAMSGGEGNDIFVFAAGDSGVGVSSLDRIWDWESGDRLQFAWKAGATDYLEFTFATYANALAFANAQIASGGVNYVAVAIGSDLVIFADSADDNGGADDAVVLVGRTLADVDASSITGEILGSHSQDGTAGNEKLEGSAGSDTLNGLAGSDTLDGGNGDDLLIGSAGNDVINGGPGVDTVSYASAAGGVNVSTYTSPYSGSDVGGGEGVDQLLSIENVIGSAFADSISSLSRQGVARGGDGNDLITSGGGFAYGEGGDDRIEAINIYGAVTLDGGDGSDILTVRHSLAFSSQTPPAVLLTGGAGDDRLTSDIGTLLGGDGNDTLQAQGYGFSLDGGTGNDSLVGGYDGVTTGGDGDDTIADGSSFANLIFGGAGNDRIVLQYAGDDTVDGGDGDDTFISIAAGTGIHRIVGGAGIDVLSYASGNIGIVARLGAAGGPDSTSGVEGLIGASGRDTLFGDSGDNTIRGGGGEDVLTGGAGDDLLDGGPGGEPQPHIEGEKDTASYAEATSGVAVSLAVSGRQTVGGGQGVDTLLSIERLRGSDFGDTLTGDADKNTLDGGAGDDVLDGGAGSDSLSGGAGNDRLNGGPGDIFDETRGGDGDDTVSGGSFVRGDAGDDLLMGSGGMDGGVGTDTASFAGEGAFVFAALGPSSYFSSAQALVSGRVVQHLTSIENLVGTGFDDLLLGSDSANALAGGAGADSLCGLAGADTLTGGAGADLFVFEEADSGVTAGQLDVITDFEAGDRLMFDIGPGAGDYFEVAAATYANALVLANAQIASGAANFVAVEVGSDVVLFVDNGDDNGTAEDAVILRGRSLAQIDVGSIASPHDLPPLPHDPDPDPDPPPPPPPPPSPPPPPPSGGGGGGGAGGDIFPTPEERGGTTDDVKTLSENQFSYDGGGGNDMIIAGAGPNLLFGGDGDDTVSAGGGSDTVVGGEGRSYLRGDDGDDRMIGGGDFDDINGNMGQDTINGGVGDDWVVGGKDGDVIFGEQGRDLVYGNIGDDVLGGGVDDDIVRGGQGNDMCRGDDGNDYVSGDRGADTMDGGLGADILHTFSEAGLDYVINFSVAEGDRVQVDPGTVYTVSQVGGDVVIDMGGDNRMILHNVELSSLPAGWIFGA